jgi:hypothetical protein
MNERTIEKVRLARELSDEMGEMDRFFAMSWGTPSSMVALSASISLLFLSLGGFLWMLHLANIIK